MKKYTAEDALSSAVYWYLKIILFFAVFFTRLVAIHLLCPTKLPFLLWGFHQCRVFLQVLRLILLSERTYRSILADGAFSSGITKSAVSYFCCAFSKSRTAFADREVGLVREGKDRDKRLRLFRCMRFRFECCFSIRILNKKQKSEPVSYGNDVRIIWLWSEWLDLNQRPLPPQSGYFTYIFRFCALYSKLKLLLYCLQFRL